MSEGNTQAKSAVRPVLILGISGGTWDVATRLVAMGRMESFRSLQERGCSLVLRSSRVQGDEHYRPQPAWATLLTGAEPADHGITRFYHTARDLKLEPIWDAYLKRGLRIGLYGCPLSWPPKPVDGFVVPSHLARDDQTWPANLQPIKRLDRRQQEAEREPELSRTFAALDDALALRRLGLGLPILAQLATSALRIRMTRDSEIRSLLLRRTKLELGIHLYVELCRQFQPEFMMFTTFFVDFVSHRYWRYFQPERFGEDSPREERLTSALADAYEAVDRGLGRLLTAVPEETVVAVVSEHGMKAEPASAELGRWRYLLRGSRVAELVGLGDELRCRPVARWVAFHPQPQRRLPSDASERLRQVMIVETKRPLFEVYEHDNEVVIKLALGGDGSRYGNGDLESLHVSYGDTSIPFRAISTRAGRQRSAMHARDGILVIAGPGIRRSETVSKPAQLADFAPTLLAAAGLPVQNPLNGRALDVFD